MRKKPVLPQVEPVVLDKILGLRAGVFIIISAFAVLLLLFFLLFVLPGLVGGGTYVSFSSNLHSLGVIVDGKYQGSTEGSRYYLEPGKHDVEYIYGGESIAEETIELPRHVFFTLFHHRTEDIFFQVENSPELERTVRESFISDVALWSSTSEYSETYAYPPIIMNFAEDAYGLGFFDVFYEMEFALMHVTGIQMAQDYLSASSYLEERGYELPTLDFDLENLFKNGLGTIEAAPSVVEKGKYSDGYFFFEGGKITLGKSGEIVYPETASYPIEVTVDPFAIARFTVSEYEYALFLEANPKWRAENKESLIEEGLVDEFYLEGVYTSTAFMSTKPVRNISFLAAEAYAEWLSDETGVQYYIPSEKEWTYAAISAKDQPYAASLSYKSADMSAPSAMFGGLWEFTSTPYIPLARLFGYDSSLSQESVDDIIVKGGSYMNSGVDESVVGVAKRSECSEYMGLRLARKI